MPEPLAKLLWAGELDGVWTPDERIRTMRRRLSRRAQLVRARSRAKNEIHAVLMRCLKDRPPASDLFGVKGRRWLAEQQLALCERETVDAGLRQVDFLDAEIAAVDQLIAAEALGWPEIKRLMTVPGVNVIVAACWSTVRQPGPIAAFYARVKAKRGHSIAIVASARKLACLFWCLLTRGEDYAYAQPSLTTKKMRRLEITAGAPRRQGGRDVWSTNTAMRQAERELALQAQRAYERTVADWQAAATVGASATPGRASPQASKSQAARQTTSP